MEDRTQKTSQDIHQTPPDQIFQHLHVPAKKNGPEIC